MITTRPLFECLDEIAPRLERERPCCALFDFDGTLVPLRRWPREVELSKISRSLLECLVSLKNVCLGIISGRSNRDLCARVRMSGIYYAGCHGLEIEGPQLSFRHPEVHKMRPLMAKIAGDLKRLTSGIPGVLVEDKGPTVALHYRNVRGLWISRLHALFHEVLNEHEEWIRVIPGKKVWEARPNVPWNKGDAVLLIMDHLRRRTASIPLGIYMGDDQTDEEAFEAMGHREGITIKVGKSNPTSAWYFVSTIREVQKFQRWIIRQRRP